ncbi:probable cytochrome P450 9f2 [Teleopsis dalmanni]|uniref:probable cytochrome P450 9f2 n=2 Tax=Teleopsis dalmanni TaxID=139649 RepID=UPI0018CDF0A4|nr:probable cytochrome P450 9f2 [Teleopsis dalmanni]
MVENTIFESIVKYSIVVYGIFDQRTPVCMLRDPELIKQVTVKEFDHFVNHRSIFNNDEGNLISSSLFSLRDAKWKDMRSTLSPVFTGSKMRQMYQLINQVAQDTAKYLKQETTTCSSEGGIEIEFKDYCTCFTSDVIASAAFGLQVNSLSDRNNEFFVMSKKVTHFTAWQYLKFFLFDNFKTIMKFLKIELFDKKFSDYFMNLVLGTMKYRVEHNISRPDMINMLMEARGLIKSEHPKVNREWTDVDMVAQCFFFFLAGFETSAVLVCFALHELMENPEVQAKLYEEISKLDKKIDGKAPTYEELQGMKYLDMVVLEVLRKWPAAGAIDRECNKDFIYEADNEKIEIKKGDNIWIPVAGIHRDPKYFENPEQFDPERFNEENKNKIKPFTYLPFGTGPRICIASRFAQLEAKTLIYYLVRDFFIKQSKKSTIPMELSMATIQLIPKSGFWLKFVPRAQ